MSDQKVIAETRWHRITEGGELQEPYTGRSPRWGDPSTETFRASDIAALLADAVRRVREGLTALVAGVDERLAKRIEAVEKRVTELDGWHPGYPDEKPLADRVSALEQDPFVEHGKRQALEERVAAVEKSSITIETFRVLNARLASLEARQENEEGPRIHGELRRRIGELADRLAEVKNHVTELELEVPLGLTRRLVALEARQQDEAAEGAKPDLDDPFDLQPLSRETRHCLTDGALEGLKEEVRRVTAREIVGRLWRFKIDGLAVAKMIERHYLPELPDEEAVEEGDQIDRDSMIPSAKETIRRDTAREIVDEIRTRDWPAAAPGLAIANWIARAYAARGADG